MGFMDDNVPQTELPLIVYFEAKIMMFNLFSVVADRMRHRYVWLIAYVIFYCSYPRLFDFQGDISYLITAMMPLVCSLRYKIIFRRKRFKMLLR